MLTLIVGIEDPQLQWFLFAHLVAVATPSCEDKFAIRDLIRGQIVSVEDEGLTLGIESTAKGLLDMAFSVGVHDVHHVKVTSCHDVANLAVSGEHLPVPIHATLHFRKLCFSISTFNLERTNCCLVRLNCCLCLGNSVFRLRQLSASLLVPLSLPFILRTEIRYLTC